MKAHVLLMTSRVNAMTKTKQTITGLFDRVAKTLHLSSAKPAEESRKTMNATDFLIEQHELVDTLFQKFESATDSQKRKIFDQIAAALVGHDTIEREIFYPACEKSLGKTDYHVDESLVEHGLVEFSLFRAAECQEPMYFDAYVHVLKEVVQHHVNEEETGLLPKVRRDMDDAQLEALGTKMKARFDATQKTDWRKALRTTIDQVMHGKTKVTGDGASRSTKSASKKKPVAHGGSSSGARRQHSAHARSRKSPARGTPAAKATRRAR